MQRCCRPSHLQATVEPMLTKEQSERLRVMVSFHCAINACARADLAPATDCVSSGKRPLTVGESWRACPTTCPYRFHASIAGDLGGTSSASTSLTSWTNMLGRCATTVRQVCLPRGLCALPSSDSSEAPLAYFERERVWVCWQLFVDHEHMRAPSRE